MFLIFDNVISKEMCDELISIGPDPKNIKSISPTDVLWSDRVVELTDHAIIPLITNYLKSTAKIEVTPLQVQIQLWPVGSDSCRHIHNTHNRERFGRTSMLYLNNDFEGGEFFTDDIIVKPVPGRLTFFDGSKTYHGVNTIMKKNRYTLIFWWD